MMQFLRTLLLSFSCLIFCQTIYSQSLKLDLTNNFGLSNFQYLESNRAIKNIAELRTEHNLNLKYKTVLAANFSARGIYNYVNRERSRMFLNEAYLAANKGKLNLKLGKQIFKYGKLTGFSNLDLANRYDYFDFLETDQEELGQWGLASKIEIKNIQFDLNYVHKHVPSVVYFEDNPWARLPNQFNHPNEPGVVVPVRLQDVVDINPEENRSSLNLGVNMELLGVTARLDYYNGYNDIPFRKIELDYFTPSIPMLYDIQLSVHPLSIYNLSVQRLYGDWNIWVEFGFIKNNFTTSAESVESDNYSVASAGLDRLFLFEDPAKFMKLVVQWRHALWNNKFEYQATDLDHVLDRCTIIDLDYQHTYDLSFGLRSVTSYDGFGFYLKPSVHYKFSDMVKISGGYAMLSGNDSHFFGHYTAEDRLTLKLNFQI